MYKHYAPSLTSLSDEYDDDDALKVFRPASPSHNHPAPAHWPKKPIPYPRHRKPSPIAQVPPEVLIHTLKYLYQPKDLFACLRVSRTWCECVVEILWQKPTFPKVSTLHKMVRVLKSDNSIFNYSSFVRRLNFATIGDALRDDFFATFACCNLVERLTLINCRGLTAETLNTILPSFSHILALDLTGVDGTTDDAIVGIAQYATRLQGVNLSGCTKVTDKGIVALAGNCPLMRRVKLSGLELLTDESVSAIAKSCSLLLELDLNHCSLITDASVREIWTHSTQMRELRLSHCPSLTDAAFPAPPLNNFYSSGSNPAPVRVVRDINDFTPLVIHHKLDSLRMLDLTACSHITDDAIDGIISHAPKIRNLVLSKCFLLSDRSVENICRLGTHLHYLHLGHANRITDRSVRLLARSCTRIRYIDFANCHLLTDMAVFELSSLPKLRRIGLVRVANLTDEAVYALAERHATLERIHLSYCDQITVMAVHFLLLKLHKLTHLSLSGVPAFRQPELQRYCREAPREFNDTQRQSFCVYSGKGISQLRTYLTELFDRITELNGTDDTDYEDDEFDDHYPEENTPEPDAETSARSRDDDLTPILNNVNLFRIGGNPSLALNSQPSLLLSPEHSIRANASATPPTHFHIPTPRGTPAQTAAHQSLPPHLQVQTPAAGPSRRTRGYVQNNSRGFSDTIPIVEALNPPSDVASNRSAATNASNGASFFHIFNREGQVTGHPPTRNDDGALTPDLNFAEIGHGRGMGNHAMRRTGEFGRQPRQPLNEADPRSSNVAPGSRTRPADLPLAYNHTLQTLQQSPQEEDGDRSASMYDEQMASPSNNAIRELQDSVAAAFGRSGRGRSDAGDEASPVDPPSGNGGRGRNVRRGLRNTLHAAEHYATSLFGRDSTDGTRDEPGPSGRRGH